MCVCWRGSCNRCLPLLMWVSRQPGAAFLRVVSSVRSGVTLGRGGVGWGRAFTSC